MEKVCVPVICLLLTINCQLKAQNYLWAHVLGGTYDIEITSVTEDNNGHVIVAGNNSDTTDLDPGSGTAYTIANGVRDAFFAKYDASGNFIWAKSTQSDPVNSSAFVLTMTTDASGNIFMAGAFQGTVDFDPGAGVQQLTSPTSFEDMFLAKFDNNGNYLWAKRMGGKLEDRVTKISVDDNGDLYVVGYFSDTIDFDPGTGVAELMVTPNPAATNLVFAKYTANGDYVFAHSLATNTRKIDVAASGNAVVVTGTFTDTVDFEPDAGVANLNGNSFMNLFFAKYDNAGNYIYANMIQTADIAWLYSGGKTIAADNSGNIYIIGHHGANCDFDPGAGTAIKNGTFGNAMFIAKYDANGNYQWVKSFDHNGNSMDAIALEDNGTVVVVGRILTAADFDPDGGTAILSCPATYSSFIGKYNGSNGNYQQAYTFCAVGSFSDLSAKAGHIYLSGLFPLGEDSIDLAPGSQDVFHYKVADHNMFFGKYVSVASSVEENSFDSNTWQIYPNPANDVLFVKSEEPIGSPVTIYNIQMQQVVVSVANANQQLVSVDVSNLSPGVYVVSINDIVRSRFVKQ